MLIKSDFKDYYDCQMQYGMNTNVVFIRKQSYEYVNEKREDIFRIPYDYIYTKRAQKLKNISLGCVGFCGTIYPFFRRDIPVKGKWEREYFYPGSNFNFVKITKTYFHLGPIYLIPPSTNYGCPTVEVNPNLSNINFAEMLSPKDAYEQLYQWHANQLMPARTIPTISDEDMVEIKGFHKKYSFRKDKK